MLLAYNTNGLAHHRLDDALALLADLGYGGVALTLDVAHLDPLRVSAAEVERVARRLDELGLARAVETGARYVLDPRRKHFPTLMEEERGDRERRLALLERCARVAADLGASVVSVWAGAAPGGEVGDAVRADAAGPVSADPRRVESLWERLTDGVAELLERVQPLGLRVGFEPEPGMFLERPAGYRELVRRLEARGVRASGPGAVLGLTLDLGHCVVTGDLPIERAIAEVADALVHVHLDDAVRGVHEHVMFGAGELDLPAALRALREHRFSGLAAVELSRDAHRGAWAAEEALRRLRAAGA